MSTVVLPPSRTTFEGLLQRVWRLPAGAGLVAGIVGGSLAPLHLIEDQTAREARGRTDAGAARAAPMASNVAHTSRRLDIIRIPPFRPIASGRSAECAVLRQCLAPISSISLCATADLLR